MHLSNKIRATFALVCPIKCVSIDKNAMTGIRVQGVYVMETHVQWVLYSPEQALPAGI